MKEKRKRAKLWPLLLILSMLLTSMPVSAKTVNIESAKETGFRIAIRLDGNQVGYCFDGELSAPKGNYDLVETTHGIPRDIITEKNLTADDVSKINAALYSGYGGPAQDTLLSRLKTAMAGLDIENSYPEIYKYGQDFTANTISPVAVDFTGFTEEQIETMAEGVTQIAIWNLNKDVERVARLEHLKSSNALDMSRAGGNNVAYSTNFYKWTSETTALSQSSAPVDQAESILLWLIGDPDKVYSYDTSPDGTHLFKVEPSDQFKTEAESLRNELGTVLKDYYQKLITTPELKASPSVSFTPDNGSFVANTNPQISESYVLKDSITLAANDIKDDLGQSGATFQLGVPAGYTLYIDNSGVLEKVTPYTQFSGNEKLWMATDNANNDNRTFTFGTTGLFTNTDILFYRSSDSTRQNVVRPTAVSEQLEFNFTTAQKYPVTITKTDLGGKEVEGATIAVYKKGETEPLYTAVSQANGQVVFELQPGDYTFKETITAPGYSVNPIEKDFTVNTDGTVTAEKGMTIENTPLKLSVSKKAITGDDELKGADFTLTKLNDDGTKEIVDLWTSDGTPHEISVSVQNISGTHYLEVGKTYELTENAAPVGYELTNTIKFTINDDGKVQIIGTGEVDENNQITVKDNPIEVSFSKYSLTGREELPGAKLTLKDSAGNIIDSWTSGTDSHVITGKLTATKEYILVEETAPEGYTIAESISFTVNQDGTVTITGQSGSSTEVIMRDDYTKVNFSKQSLFGSNELPGASLKVEELDENGKVVKTIDEWTSTDAVHQIVGKLVVGKTYQMTEVTAPQGYEVAESIKFTIDEKGKAVVNGTAGDTVTMKDSPIGISFSKKTIAGSDELPGAVLKITDVDGNFIDGWTSGTEPHNIKTLEAGKTYFMIEETAPNGYIVAEKIEFTVNDDGTATIKGQEESTGTIVMRDAQEGTVSFSKKAVNGTEELPGAKLTVKDKDGNVIRSWTSQEGKAEVIEGMQPGEYTMVEETAPAGYIKAESITFTVHGDGSVSVNGQTAEGNVVTMLDDYTKTTISKQDITNNQELPGATLQILDANGKIVEEWVSGAEPHTFNALPVGDYTLVEITAPNGYSKAESIPFKVTETGIEQVVTMLDAPNGVSFSKKAVNGTDELAGAKLKVLDKDGKVVDSWTSTDTPHIIEKMTAGEYTMVEETAPDGYVKAESITFTVNEDGSVIVNGTTGSGVTMLDDYTKVQISKKDIAGSDELPGATLIIKDKDGKEIERWVSTDKPYVIEKLPVGDYTLVEETAPDGYTVAEEVPFTVTETGEIQTVEMTDKPTEVYLTKKDITTGDELPGATLIVKDKDGNEIDRWVSTDEPHKIEKLTEGETYTLIEETHPFGYVTAEEITFVVGKDGVTIENPIIMVDDYTKFEFSKFSITGSQEIPGAKLTIKDKDGKVVDSWTSTDTPHIVTKLNPGDEYTLIEEAPPEGYYTAAAVKFTVSDTGEVQKVAMRDEPVVDFEVVLTKTDLTTAEPVPGATVVIKDSDGKVVFEGVTDEKGQIKTTKLAPGNYTFEETIAPVGYDRRTDSFPFTIDKDGKVTGTTTFTDAPLQVDISKVAITGGPELPGAELSIIDKETGEVIESWTSTSEVHRVSKGKLKESHTYILHENLAPIGYELAQDIEFTVANTGEVQKVEMIDEIKPELEVGFSKKDITTGEEIPGAKLSVYKKNPDGTRGELIETWISGNTPHIIKGLEKGETYTMVEEIHPDGFVPAEAIDFVAGVGNLVEMFDDYTKVDISKQDATTGQELAGAKLTLTDDFTGKVVASWTSGTTPYRINYLVAGRTYTLHEDLSPLGYHVASDVKFTVSLTGEVQKVVMKDEVIKVTNIVENVNTGIMRNSTFMLIAITLIVAGLSGIAVMVLIKNKRSSIKNK
ncbi:SpaA isopeptide-forming pilin-related protein [Eubacterium sp. 1001713B170207_170306_E7]|uniref:SpaA isopeptide-forming pilin-related protein n=1 Tax=Eubacterium sp. 1001713B170207_170306_E7 TaxID=2787097 RepID=UPI001899A261|nr:SpaA isopeptide-forming pilin-related protein [Eubacterium sp. 1001713B170207_170306_E7]